MLLVAPLLAGPWDRLGPAPCVYANARWLGAMGDRLPGEPLAFWLEARGRPAAALCAAVTGDESSCTEAFSPHRLLAGPEPVFPLSAEAARARRQLRGAPAPGAWHPCLIVGFPGYHCDLTGPAAREPAAAHTLVERLVGWAAAQGLRLVAFLYVPAAAGGLREALAAAGFRRCPLTVRSRLALGGGLDGCLARLPGRRRREVGRELRTLRAAGFETALAGVVEHAGEVVALRAALVARYGGYSTPEAEAARLDGLIGRCGADLRLFLTARGGDPAAFSLFVEHGPRWHVVWCGQDYALGGRDLLYFESLFYAPVRFAPAGVVEIDYGIGHERAKRARGCRLEPLEGWFLALAPRLDGFLRRALAALAA